VGIVLSSLPLLTHNKFRFTSKPEVGERVAAKLINCKECLCKFLAL
jgi:hypothetical protein